MTDRQRAIQSIMMFLFMMWTILLVALTLLTEYTRVGDLTLNELLILADTVLLLARITGVVFWCMILLVVQQVLRVTKE
ncbi:MAG: hypothetical protein ACW99G_13830 [Candidatus Thorarchaeota archaeon]|jgi:hypothetical protein